LKMSAEELLLNPNEPNPGFMVYKEEARKIILQSIAGTSEVFWILGDTGIGKTTFLLWLKEFSPMYHVEPIMMHGGENLTLDEVKTRVESAIRPSFFSRAFLRKAVIERPVLLLLDEVDYIRDKKIFQYLISKLDEPHLQMSAVLSSADMVNEIIDAFLKGRDIDKINLKMLSTDTIMEMVKRRIEVSGGDGFRPFGKQMVRDVIESSSTIRDVLIKLEESAG